MGWREGCRIKMEMKRAKLKCFVTGLVLSVFMLLAVLHVTGPSGGYHLNAAKTEEDTYLNYHSLESNHVRLNRMKRTCSLNRGSIRGDLFRPKRFKGIYVDDTYQLLYCEVPKVACTNWKRIFLLLSGKVNTSDPMRLESNSVHGRLSKLLRTLDSYNSSEIHYRINNYLKFMFVRDPMERLLSAYRNKFTLRYNEYFKYRYGKKIVKKYRQNATKEALEKGHDVQFHEFIQYLLDPTTQKKKPFNTHWRPYYQLCHPCIVNYDVIGKYETLDRDAQYILKRARLDDIVQFPKAPSLMSKTEEVLNRFYSNISAEQIHELWELYSVDYSMFGYNYPQFKHS